MKNKLTTLLIILFILFSYSGFSQYDYIMGIDEYIEYANIDRTNSLGLNTYLDVKGSPFLDEEFSEGQVILNDGKTYKGPLRFDIYAGQMEFKTNNDEVYALANPEVVNKVKLNGKEFVYCPNDATKPDKGRFYEVVFEDVYSLLINYNVTYKDPEPPKPYVDAKPATFTRRKDNFVVYNFETGIFPIENKKDLQKITPEKKEEIKDFIKENKTKVTDNSDMIAFVEFLNSLQL